MFHRLKFAIQCAGDNIEAVGIYDQVSLHVQLLARREICIVTVTLAHSFIPRAAMREEKGRPRFSRHTTREFSSIYGMVPTAYVL